MDMACARRFGARRGRLVCSYRQGKGDVFPSGWIPNCRSDTGRWNADQLWVLSSTLRALPGARILCEAMGFPVPIYAKKRCVFSFSCPKALSGFPLLIDTSGVWVRPEGRDFITGFSPDDLDTTDHGQDFDVDWALFEEVIWPALAARIPAFETIRPGRAWAGHYDMCLLDHNALVGPVPGLANAYMAAGFSGHGLQQSPAVGRGLAELILHGRYESLDLSALVLRAGCSKTGPCSSGTLSETSGRPMQSDRDFKPQKLSVWTSKFTWLCERTRIDPDM